MSNVIVTRESLTRMLQDPNTAKVQAVIGRALTLLLARQTREEAEANTTRQHNTVGFSSSDARTGCLTAKYWLKHKRLEDWMIAQWTRDWKGAPRLAKYHAQLNEEAIRKQEKTSA